MVTKQNKSNKGRIHITARDWSGLRFAAEMYTVRLDHLGQLFAPGLEPAQRQERNSPAYPPGQKRLRLPWPRDPERRIKNTYEIVRRWQLLGFAQLEKPFENTPMWCWVTRRGLNELGLPYDADFPARGDLNHIYQVNQVRLTLARAAQIRASEPANQVPLHAWVGERALAAEQDERLAGAPVGHRPDGVLRLRDGSLEAVEVELTRKSYERLQDILEELTAPTSGYSRVRYFVAEGAAAALVEARAQLDEQQQEQVLIYRL